MAFFDNVTSQSNSAESQAIEKALSAGYGTDSATFVNGRAMIPEDLESTTVNVVAALKEDCKVFNGLKKEPVASTVHEYNRRTEHGDYRFLSVAEGAKSAETNQALERKFLEMKYLQTRRSVTKQMETVKTFEGALASEKLAGIETIIKATEHQIFHGNSAVIPTEFDGLEAQLRAKDSGATIKDCRGKSLGTLGEGVIDDVARAVWDKGGDLTRALFPSVLAKDFKEMVFGNGKAYYNLNAENKVFNFGGKALPDYLTPIGSTIALSGDNAGADKFYRVKGEVVAAGDVNLRPKAPKTVTLAAAATANSLFTGDDAGEYKYSVHAVNAAGISPAFEVEAPATVAKGDGVKITITPADDGMAATGFIICRSAKGGDKVMEMVQVGKAKTGTTTEYVDINEELPGTGSVILLSEGRTSKILSFEQMLPVSTVPLYPSETAETPFLVVMYGALENRAPQFCGMLNNISYAGGLY